jgi:hypothetical protein
MIDRLRLALARIGLPAWFVAIDLLWIAKPGVLGVDARLYQRAATAWLAGGDPWAVAEAGVPYAAGPHTLLFYVPTSQLPIVLSTAAWVSIGLVASVWLVRRLGLPLWWLAFPPLSHAIWNGNPQTLAMALLVLGGSGRFATSAAAAAGAIMFKLYAALPLVVRPRQLVAAAVVLAALLLVVPWQLYLQEGLGVSTHLGTAWNGSAWRVPLLIPPAILGLWILRRAGGEWLSVPAVWPATQFYYVAMALPALVGRPLLAAAFALPVPLLVPVAVIVMAARELRRDRSTLWPAFATQRT